MPGNSTNSKKRYVLDTEKEKLATKLVTRTDLTNKYRLSFQFLKQYFFCPPPSQGYPPELNTRYPFKYLRTGRDRHCE